MAASFEIDFAYVIDTITIISSSIISSNPSNGDFNPKNKNDHNAFSAI
jgi:hypothetical protein